MTMTPPATILSDLLPEARATPVAHVDVDVTPVASAGPMTPLEADLARVEALRRGLPESRVVVRLRPGAAVGLGHPWIHLPRDVEVLPEGAPEGDDAGAAGGQTVAQAAPPGATRRRGGR